MQNATSIGFKIAEARKNKNFSQADLAQRISISPQAVGKWERGESNPDLATFFRLTEILGVDLQYFTNQNEATEISESANTETEIVTRPKNKTSLKWDMSQGNWVDADFSGLKNLQEKFGSSNVKNCKFIGADLTGISFNSNNIELCDFTNSTMKKSIIFASNVLYNNFKGCDVEESEFSKSNIEYCNFSNANFTGATIAMSNFSHCEVNDTKWKLTSFSKSAFNNITFTGLIEECSFDQCSYSKVTFKNATILFTFFKGKKLKGITFIDCQVDKITYEFLKNGKAGLTGITVISE